MESLSTDPESGERFRASPLRDISYFAPQLVEDVGNRLDFRFLPGDDQLKLKSHDLTEADLRRAFACFMLFFERTLKVSIKSPYDAMTAAGFFACHPVCQDIILKTFGIACLGATWHGMRSANMADVYPPLISAMREEAQKLLSVYGPPPTKG